MTSLFTNHINILVQVIKNKMSTEHTIKLNYKTPTSILFPTFREQLWKDQQQDHSQQPEKNLKLDQTRKKFLVSIAN